MSTNSMIGILKKDGSVESVYCHFDGYLEHNGEILFNHYKDVDKVNELLDLGDLSYLASKLSPGNEVEHSFNFPQDGVCLVYGRDRNEPGCEKNYSESLKEFEELYNNSSCEYAYLFNEETNKWLVATDMNSEKIMDNFKSLETELMASEIVSNIDIKLGGIN